jgi:peptidoglycan/LPS O-acetylase OafA/YrhL
VINHSISYRADVDGLRALAVLPVVLFHAFPQMLPGGFIGVDIFFVISGYLITRILLNDMQAGEYSLSRFYARRIRRIFPALSLVLVFCLALGWIVLTATEYRQLAKHALGGVGFVANMVFWKEAGYFDAAADTKPLLHFWSLGIEEQFYIVWPLLLFFVFKRSWNIWWVLAVVGLASFALNVARIQIDPTGTFYSPLSRSWELALGACLAYQTVRPAQWCASVVERYRSVLSFFGLLLVLIGFVVIHEARLFPGWWAVLPALGAALMMIAGPGAWLNRVVLSHRWMVGVGLISFPLYLWHWPLLSFARIIYSETPPADIRWMMVALSVVLAWLTFVLIEKPIRRSQSKRSLIIVLSVLMVTITAAALAVYKTKGAGSRHSVALNADPASLVMGADRGVWQKECGIPESAKKILNSCYSPRDQKAQYAIWGDSKGEALFYGLAREAQKRTDASKGAWMMIGNVAPIIGDIPRVASIAHLNQYAIDSLVGNPDVKMVLVAPAARALFSLRDAYTREELNASPLYEESLLGVSNAIGVLEKAGKKAAFLIDHPGFPDPRSCISGGLTNSDFLNQFLFRKENPRCSMTYEQYLEINERYRLWIAELQKRHPRLIIYDPIPVVCDIPGNHCGIARDGQFLYSYGDHYSDFGNSLVAKDFLAQLPSLLKK